MIKNLINAWQQAADDLQIKIQSPFVLTISDSKTIQFDLFIENFGTKQGTVILSIEDINESNLAEQLGYFCSTLNYEYYSTYERNHFIDTLNDWGYFGEISNKPNWYSGQPWS